MNTLTFSFSNFIYSDIRSVQYQYYMEGLEEGWSRPTGRNTATYTKLPPGDYRLHVRSNDGRGNWGGEATLALTVLQPWWNSAAARAAYALAAILLATVSALGLRRIWTLRKRLEVERSVTELKINFFTGVTHELTVPLTLIRAATDQIVSAGRNGPSASATRTIVSNAARLGAMVEKLMLFRKISKAALTPSLRRADFVLAVRAVCDSFRSAASGRGVRITLTPFAKTYAACFDRDMVETVVGNLLDNAVRFSPAGGTVAVGVSRSGGTLAVTVADDGPGVDDRLLPRLFTPYAGMKTRRGGLGMGLYISRQTAKAMGGTLAYARAAGGGALFTLTLPDAQTADADDDNDDPGTADSRERRPAATDVVEMMPVPMNAGVTVVVAEDDEETLSYIKYRLGEYFTIATADSAEAALEAADAADAHLVVAAMSPHIDGISLAARLSRRQEPRTRAIIIADDGSRRNRLAAIKAGADDFLARPFSMDVLVASCARSVGEAARWRRLAAGRCREERPLAPAAEVITELKDKRFVDNFNRILAAHAAEPDFTADAFARLMGLGRAQFYKLTTELTGQPPAAHLRRARLDRVARLLLETNMSVDEIRAAVGFATPTHFHNLFRSRFGVSPLQYRKMGGAQRAQAPAP